jgi:hypothetical protein
MAKKKFYLSAPQDDFGFLESLKKTHGELLRKIPTREELTELTRKEGIDIATGVFYLSLFSDPANGAWIQKIEDQPVEKFTGTARGKVLIVPAMFYEEYPEVGGNGPQILEIARACGFKAEVIPTKSPGPLHRNVEIIYETIKSDPEGEIWLASMSRGGLEVRLVLEKYGADFPFHKMKGWINACGFPSGSSLVDINVSTWFGWFRWWVIGKVVGCDIKHLVKMGENDYRGRSFPEVPPSFKVINIVPFARPWHVQMSLTGRFKTLAPLGPNDGIATTRSSMIGQYPTYPMWATDHFFRNEKVVPLLYKLFGVLRET